jgi:hypothetical protein
MEVWGIDGQAKKLDEIPDNELNTMVNFGEANEGTRYYLSNNGGTLYTIAKIEYGHAPGYRLTELTYAGDLISSAGESLTSILDKIVNMLTNYEYFYDIDGRFVFQRKKNYVNTVWNNIKSSEEGDYAAAANAESAFSYEFRDNVLISSFSNSPNI